MGQTDPVWVEIGLGMAVIVPLIALPIAIPIALALIRLFRRRVAQSMRTAAGVPQDPAPLAGGGPEGALDIEAIEPERVDARDLPPLEEARRQSRELAAIHGEAACVYPLVFAFLWWTPGASDILRLLALFGFFVLVLATPVVFASVTVLSRHPGVLALAACSLIAVLLAVDSATRADARIAVYVLAAVPILVVLMLRMLRKEPRFAILTVIAVAGVLIAAIPLWGRGSGPGTDSAGLWVMIAGVPTLAAVLLNTQRLRAVGPIVFAATLLLLFGAVAGAAYAAVFVVHAVDAQFLREDLAQLPFPDAFQLYLQGMSLPEQVDAVRAIVRDPGRVYRYDTQNWTLWVKLIAFGIAVIPALLGAVAAAAAVRWLAGTYERRRSSDQMLTIDTMMLIFVVPNALLLTTVPESRLHGVLLGAIGLASFAGYKFWARLRLRLWRRRRPPPSPRALLLLRVFGFDRRTRRLLEDVGRRWRSLGPIRLIAGPDLASATLEPHEFWDFVNGRLSRAFVKDREDLEGRLTEAPVVPDPDGRFRVEDFFCHDDTWRMTVSRLARDSEAVLMDLRGFSPANRGCIFEIEQLIAGVPLDRVVLLADASTDTVFLETTLRDAWRAMPGDSPNAAAGRHRVRILKAGAGHRRTLRCLLGLLCRQFPDPAVAPAPSAQGVRPEATA